MTPVTWLRVSYWAGAIADALIAILVLLPSRMGEAEFRYPMGLASTMVFGWTVLLVWADRKPVARKAILLITVFPVITGLLLSGMYSVGVGLLPARQIVPSLVLGVTLIILMVSSYWNARNLDPEPKEPSPR
jgi:hypothetical protein